MKYNFDYLENRKNTNSMKWDANKEYFGKEDLLPFWVADMDFPCAEPIVEALRQRVSHHIYGYTVRNDSYYESIIQWLERRHQWKVKKEYLAFCPPGVVQAINIMINCFSDPVEEIILQIPSYKPLINVIKNNERRMINNPLLLQNGSYHIDFDDLLKKINKRTKILLFCSPHNPTGRVWTKDELHRLGEICLKNNILVISDEIHADIVFKEYKHIPFGSLPKEIAYNSVTCISASKTFNISGLQQATMIIPNPDLRKKFMKFIDTAQINQGNTLGEVAVEAGYRYGEEWLDQVIDYIEGNLFYLMDFIENHIPEINVIKPQGTYLVWLDFRKLGISTKEINKILINRAGIALYDGYQFGEGQEGFFRLNLACPRSMLTEGLNRMKISLDSYKQ